METISEKKVSNGDLPAHPFVPNLEGTMATPEQAYGYGGLTKRELFAMAAMQSYATPYVIRLTLWQRLQLLFTGKGNVPVSHGAANEVATNAVRQADELLKHLEKQTVI